MWATKMRLRSLLLLFALCCASIAQAHWLNRFLGGKRMEKSVLTEIKPRPLLPQLQPHDDTCYLLEFISDESDHCSQMEPVVRRLEHDLRTKVRRINISRKHEYVKLYECVGGNECGSVPFFYNRRTAQAICGATPYHNLKNLAMGKPIHFFHDAPQNVNDKVEHDPRKQRGVGLSDYISEKLFRRGMKVNRL
jgi:hypothetical protein